MRPLPLLSKASVSVFQTSFFAPQLPCRFPRSHFTQLLPAISTWFNPDSTLNRDFFSRTIGDQYKFVSVEVTSVDGTFERKDIPFLLFLEYLSLESPSESLPNLYLAQVSLLDAFPELQKSFEPTPDFVTSAGKGDIYATNLWLGRSNAINTPLHKDPNPNLFVQLCGRKKLRLFEPDVGKRLLQDVDDTGHSLIAFRGEDMMVGERKEAIEEQVWEKSKEGFEIEVEPGDGIFIPRGWWHAVRGVGTGVGGSVNWWFR
ncbi:hypothetical protein EDC01DRAFT_640915 [Geopyxis carbonaria]|nr:hypothetical protein EDC01DRAFT_640915 [Geopyxis carbonaria]